jgi:hypothetical protein
VQFLSVSDATADSCGQVDIEHVKNPNEFLSIIAFHTKLGGYVYVETPDSQDMVRGTLGGDHISLFAKAHLRACVEFAGMEIIQELKHSSVTDGIGLVLRKPTTKLSPDAKSDLLEGFERGAVASRRVMILKMWYALLWPSRVRTGTVTSRTAARMFCIILALRLVQKIARVPAVRPLLKALSRTVRRG